MDHRFDSSDGVRLAAHLARPRGEPSGALVLCHGFPSGYVGPKSAHTYPQLADRFAQDLGWLVLAFNFRGCAPSGGSFSLRGWVDDARRAADHVAELGGEATWICGFGTGGAVAVCAAAGDERVRGVAAVAAPADFVAWARGARRLVDRCREVGLLGPDEPEDTDAWARQLRDVRTDGCAAELAPRPLLLVHGSEDESVPVLDSRAVADAHGSADLRIIDGAAHQLRHDPRAIALLLGWFDRQRVAVQSRPSGPLGDDLDRPELE